MHYQGPNLMNLSNVGELSTAGKTLNHRFKVKDSVTLEIKKIGPCIY